jgi:hypothetical protein
VMPFAESASRDRSIEFAKGLSEEQARREASRCLRCDLAYLCPSITVKGSENGKARTALPVVSSRS